MPSELNKTLKVWKVRGEERLTKKEKEILKQAETCLRLAAAIFNDSVCSAFMQTSTCLSLVFLVHKLYYFLFSSNQLVKLCMFLLKSPSLSSGLCSLWYGWGKPLPLSQSCVTPAEWVIKNAEGHLMMIAVGCFQVSPIPPPHHLQCIGP